MLQAEDNGLFVLPLLQKKSFLKVFLKLNIHLQSILQHEEPQYWMNAEDR